MQEQASNPVPAHFTLVQFDGADPHETMIDSQLMTEVRLSELGEFLPRGNTPLYDAIGMLVERADRHVAAGGDDADQLVVIFTDGQENASQRWTRRRVFDAVNERRTRGWTFVFMGANQDAYATGESMSMSRRSSANWDASPVGAELAFESVSDGVRRQISRSRAAKLAMRDRFFDKDDEQQVEAD